MPVHFAGNPCEMGIIQSICEKYDLKLMTVLMLEKLEEKYNTTTLK